MNKRSKTLVRDYSIIGGVVLIVTLAIMVVKPTQQPLLEFGLLAAGLTVGALLLRFSVPRWMAHLFLLAWLVISLVLGNLFLGWFGGFIAGSNLGVVWRALATREKTTHPWTVDGKGYGTVTEVRKAAIAALRSLDGKKNWRLTVEHGAARFDASGSAATGLLCHRTPNVEKGGTRAILERPDIEGTGTVVVPMGGLNGTIPSRFVGDLEAAEIELERFLQDAESALLGPAWNIGEIAEDLHLGS